jgi:hypothetical protein
MPETPHPSLEEISVVLAHLADRVHGDSGPGLDPLVGLSIERLVSELELHIPGLQAPPDADAARALAKAAGEAVAVGRPRIALARALRGLSFAPHHPQLHYLAATACLELGAVQEAVQLLSHTVWIHPGFEPARRDLETLSAYGEAPRGDASDAADDPAQGGQGELWEDANGEPRGSGFELEERDPWGDDDLEGWERAA